MNKSFKIILLAVAVLIAAGGVLVFLQSIAAPPKIEAKSNQFEDEIKAQLKQIQSQYEPEIESGFMELEDLLKRFKAENVIDEAMFDDNYAKLVEDYAPKFAEYSLAQFRKSSWDSSQHKWMQSRIAFMRTLTVNGGKQRVIQPGSDVDAKINKINSIIGKYQNALAASRGSFTSPGTAAATISRASQFANDADLKPNASLMSALHGVRERVANSHYNYVAAQVAKLANYRNVSMQYYTGTLVNQVAAAINEYRNMTCYGSAKRPTDDLTARARSYRSAAVDYYSDL